MRYRLADLLGQLDGGGAEGRTPWADGSARRKARRRACSLAGPNGLSTQARNQAGGRCLKTSISAWPVAGL